MKGYLVPVGAAAAALLLAFPPPARSQGGGSSGGYGIFGGGAGLGNGGSSYSGRGGLGYYQLSRPSYGSVSAQGGVGGSSMQPFQRPTVSPYLNLVNRPSGVGAATAYFGIVRPQIQQENRDWANSYKIQELQGELRERAKNPEAANPYMDWAETFKAQEKRGEQELRKRLGIDNPDVLYEDWATNYKEQEALGEQKQKSKQRTARASAQRKAQDNRINQQLKILEGQLSASATGGGNKSITPSMLMGTQPLGTNNQPTQYMNPDHFFPQLYQQGWGGRRTHGNGNGRGNR